MGFWYVMPTGLPDSLHQYLPLGWPSRKKIRNNKEIPMVFIYSNWNIYINCAKLVIVEDNEFLNTTLR